MAVVSIRVNPEYPYDTVRVSGFTYTKLEPTLRDPAELTDETLKSPLLVITAVAEPAPTPSVEADTPNAQPIDAPTDESTATTAGARKKRAGG